MNPYVSSIGVYLNKIGKAPEVEDNEAMRQGRDMEDYVARRFSEKTASRFGVLISFIEVKSIHL